MGFFAKQTPPATDPFWTSVVLLCHFDGTNGQTTTTDNSNSAHALTLGGAVTLTTTTPQFGTACLNVPINSADFMSSPDSADWNFGAGSWTVECWIQSIGTISTQRQIVGQWQTAGNNKSWTIFRTATNLQVGRSSDGATTNLDIDVAATLTAATWYNLTVDYDSVAPKLRLYLNGTMIGSSTTARTLFDSAVALTVGNQPDASNFKFGGLVDELRITKGIARYASDAGFTVPAAAFPNS